MVYHNRKIRNKERVGFRGTKKRYSVFRAELNRKWEKVFEKLVKGLCEDNGLSITDHMIEDERIPWEHTFDELRKKGYELKHRRREDIENEEDAKRPSPPKVGRK